MKLRGALLSLVFGILPCISAFSQYRRLLIREEAAYLEFHGGIDDHDGSNLRKRSIGVRPGKATRYHSCGYIRNVPNKLRSAKEMGPDGLDPWYVKYTEAYGIPVLGGKNASVSAMQRACYIVRFIYADIESVRQQYYAHFGRVAVIGLADKTNDIPEHQYLEDWWNDRARGLGATISAPICTIAVENLMCMKHIDAWNEDIGLHEFAHGQQILGADYGIPGFKDRLTKTYNDAKAAGLWHNTYAQTNRVEYWAEGVQSYFNAEDFSEVANGITNDINTRDKLKVYDNALYNLIKDTFLCNNTYLLRCRNGTPAEKRAEEIKQYLKMDCSNGTPSGTSTGGMITTTQSTTTGSTCTDIGEYCDYWKKTGYCTSGEYKPYMLSNCKKSCGVCPIPKCEDENTDCHDWSKSGYCTDSTYGPYMKSNCKMSCKLC